MSDQEKSFAGSYKPWGSVRRRNLIARVLHTAAMTVLGLAVIAGLILLVVFAASLAVIGVAALSLMALAALVMRKPVRIFVRSERPQMPTKADGLFEAHKKGSTWIVY